jgi:phenylpropionate dioxygenase-like ring-hydroxylating dioxygenase large terminal subunit
MDATDLTYAEPDAETRGTVADPRLFGQHEELVATWYWAMQSRQLGKGQVKPLNLCGRELAIWRGEDGQVHCVDAHCPHMGAHLAEGKVRGNELECFFHGWKYGGEGQLTDIPCQERTPDVCLKTWPTEERYGLIWVYTGDSPEHGVFEVPELKGLPVDAALGTPFEKGCHPNIVMVNAIDEQHFTTVHNLPVDLSFKITEDTANHISFDNQTHVPDTRAALRFIGRFYEGPLTYKMHYLSGTNGSVTVGPDFIHFHIIFALRPTADGKCEGQTILITNRRRSVFGWALNRVLLFATQLVGDYFAHGDTKIFQTIQWKFAQPIAADRSIIRFIKHLEKMKTVRWGSWSEPEKLLTIAKKPSGLTAEGEAA